MSGRRHHYERAFEAYLRDRRIPYVSVADARKALLPESAGLRLAEQDGSYSKSLKSFDFMIYGEQDNLLIEVKGRKVPLRRGGSGKRANTTRRLECWVTRQDLDALQTWEKLFGDGFEAAFCFCYWCEEQPPDGLFQELIVHQDRWYALRSIRLRDYLSAIRVRSLRWGTFDLPAAEFEALSHPLAPPRSGEEAGPEPLGFDQLGSGRSGQVLAGRAGTLYDPAANR